METDVEKSTAGAFERFFIWIFIPLVFTTVLLGVLLSMFDYDVMNGLLKAGSKVPVVNRILPEPSVTKDEELAALSPEEQWKVKQAQLEEEVARLQERITEQENELKLAAFSVQEKEQSIEQLQVRVQELERELEGKKLSDEEYSQQVRQLASTYAAMLPSRSASILQYLTTSERVLILGNMRQDDRVKILEKMDPRIAAETSIMLKDTVPSKDREIAALQERLALNAQSETAQLEQDKLSLQDLAATVGSMAPKNAAALLLEMAKLDDAKVTSIIGAMDNAARSRIISAISEVSSESAARFIDELG